MKCHTVNQTLIGLKHFDYNEVTSFSYQQLFQSMRVA